MSVALNELKQRRGEAIVAMRAIREKAKAESRKLTADEEAQWNKIDDEQDELRQQIEAAEREGERDRRIAALEEEARSYTKAPIAGAVTSTAQPSAGEVRASAFGKYLVDGYRAAYTEAEFRALQSDLATSGGYLRPDEQFNNGLIKSIDDSVFIRALATKFTVSTADSLGTPSLDADPADADWTAEIGSVSEDSTMSFGKRELHPHQLSKLLKVSRKLLRQTAGGAATLVQQRLAYKFAVTEESAFLTGSGAGQPLGVFTASDAGVATGRDVTGTNTTTAITASTLIDAAYSLKEGYLNRARWVMHRDTAKQARKLTDSNGSYIWQPGLAGVGITGLNSGVGGTGDTLLSKPVHLSEYAPNTFSASQYVAVLGDFSYYWIADAQMMELQRLEELYAANSQVGFIGRMWFDGQPVLSEAFARVQLAAA